VSLSCLSRQLEVLTSTRDLKLNPAAPVAVGEERAANRPLIKDLANHVGQQAEEAGALDRLGEFALLLLADGGDARRHDLATL
jgi:hypothetical protein